MARDDEKVQKREEERHRAALIKTLDTREGRRVVWWLLERAGVYRSTFCGEESHRTAHLEGRRAIGLELLSDVMEYAPQQYAVMQTEAKSEEING